MKEKIEIIANICYDLGREIAGVIGEEMPTWDAADPAAKNRIIQGVIFRVLNPNAPVDSSQAAWKAEMKKHGWKYGKTLDDKKKLHPMLLDFKDLPQSQQVKDVIFARTVVSLSGLNISRD